MYTLEQVGCVVVAAKERGTFLYFICAKTSGMPRPQKQASSNHTFELIRRSDFFESVLLFCFHSFTRKVAKAQQRHFPRRAVAADTNIEVTIRGKNYARFAVASCVIS